MCPSYGLCGGSLDCDSQFTILSPLSFDGPQLRLWRSISVCQSCNEATGIVSKNDKDEFFRYRSLHLAGATIYDPDTYKSFPHNFFKIFAHLHYSKQQYSFFGGLKWQLAGSNNQHLRELNKTQVEIALKCTTEFTLVEWISFSITDLHLTCQNINSNTRD